MNIYYKVIRKINKKNNKKILIINKELLFIKINNKMWAQLLLLILYITFITFIYIGGGFITNTLFNKGFDPSCVGLDNDAKLNIAKFTVVVFWIVFIPLGLVPLIGAIFFELI